jgi:ABC-type nitrate/sulfonate/bicarbonate transport system permease component
MRTDRSIQLGLLVGLAAVWQISAVNGWVSPLILPTLTDTLSRFATLLSAPPAYETLGVTLFEFAVAMSLALTAGLVVGALCGTNRYLGDLLEPMLLALYAVPIVMAFPLCVLFFGIGSSSKIAFAALYAFFPIAIQTLKGLRHVDPALIRTAVSLGASRRQLLFKVRLPAAFPVILAGVRLGAVLGLLTVVAGEMLGALAGIGQALSSAVQTFESAEAFAWILLVVALVSFVNSGLSWLERRVAGEP